VWDDTKIESGEEWEKKITEELSKAKIAVLLVSSNFFASEYVWRKELPQILENANNNGATILWLPVDYCDYEDTGIEKYQSVSNPQEPLEELSLSARKKIYTDLSKRIKTVYKQISTK
jgi:hypothetical protein